MNRRVPLPFLIGPLVAALCAVLGVMMDEMVVAYLVPAIISGVVAALAIWQFIRHKRNLSYVILYGGTFLLFHFQLCLPAYWRQFTPLMAEYSPGARLFGAVGTDLLPLACALTLVMLNRLWGLKDRDVNRSGEDRTEYKEGLLFAAFLALFALVALPNVLFGGVVRTSIDAILYMRNTTAVTGGVAVATEATSLLNINHFASSLVMLSVALFRSRYRLFVLALLPLSVIWAVASIFAMGTRTQVLQFGVCFLVPLIGSPAMRLKNIFGAGVVALLIFGLAQTMSVYRNVGLQEVRAGELFGSLAEMQGLETMHDQTRALEMFLGGYRNPDGFDVAPIDLAFGMVYRPIELLTFPLPRSLFPWKPIDPTVHDLNIWAIRRLGVDADRFEWGITGGLIGRDTLRWGPLGSLVAIFWFSVLCWYADRNYVRDRWSLNQRLVAGAFAGTAMAMYRDLSPLWCLQVIPGAVIIMWTRINLARQVRRVRVWRRPRRALARLRRTT